MEGSWDNTPDPMAVAPASPHGGSWCWWRHRSAVVASIGLAGLFGVPPGEWQDSGQLYLIVPVFVYVAVFGGPLGEDPGWRGHAFPQLERRFTPRSAPCFWV